MSFGMSYGTRIHYILPATGPLPAKAFAEVEVSAESQTHNGSPILRARIEIVEVPFHTFPPDGGMTCRLMRGCERFYIDSLPSVVGGIFEVPYGYPGHDASGHGHADFEMHFAVDFDGEHAVNILRHTLLTHLKTNRHLSRRQSAWGKPTLFDDSPPVPAI